MRLLPAIAEPDMAAVRSLLAARLWLSDAHVQALLEEAQVLVSSCNDSTSHEGGQDFFDVVCSRRRGGIGSDLRMSLLGPGRADGPRTLRCR